MYGQAGFPLLLLVVIWLGYVPRRIALEASGAGDRDKMAVYGQHMSAFLLLIYLVSYALGLTDAGLQDFLLGLEEPKLGGRDFPPRDS